jgi:chromate transporter
VRRLASVWIAIGTRSIGGGASTLMLIRRYVVERERLVTAREFTEDYALSQLSPGIHLVALAGLLGRRIAGWRGVIVSVAGLMVPAGIITVLLTAAYSGVADHPLAQAALAGMGPATGGMTAALAALLVRETRRHGSRFAIDLMVVAAAFAALTFAHASNVLVVLASAALGAVLLRGERPTSERAAE